MITRCIYLLVADASLVLWGLSKRLRDVLSVEGFRIEL